MAGAEEMIQPIDSDRLQSAAIEARLSQIEEMLGDLHSWMRSEQVSSLPNAYRRLNAHLIARDFDRRYAARITQAIHQEHGGRDLEDRELVNAAIEHIKASIGDMEEALPKIRKRENGERPYVFALVGSSGAGKTTTMYKLAVRAVLKHGLRVKIISCDTYKIGSVEGVQTIADILNVPVGVAFEPDEVQELIDEVDVDLVIVDTAGRAGREAREELSGFLRAARPNETHLVLSSTMSGRAIQETAALFLGEKIDYVTFTKLDEAPSLGAMISSIDWVNLPIGYLSTGTMIPDDLIPSNKVDIGSWSIEGLPTREHNAEAHHV